MRALEVVTGPQPNPEPGDSHGAENLFFFPLAISRAEVGCMVVLSSRSGRNLLLPVLGGFGTSRDGTQQIRSFPKPMLFSWDVFLFPSLQLKFLNTSLGRKSMLTHRALFLLKGFLSPKAMEQQKPGGAASQTQHPSLQSTSCGSHRASSSPPTSRQHCVFTWRLETSSGDSRLASERDVGRQKTVWISDFPWDVKEVLGGMWVV